MCPDGSRWVCPPSSPLSWTLVALKSLVAAVAVVPIVAHVLSIAHLSLKMVALFMQIPSIRTSFSFMLIVCAFYFLLLLLRFVSVDGSNVSPTNILNELEFMWCWCKEKELERESYGGTPKVKLWDSALHGFPLLCSFFEGESITCTSQRCAAYS